MKRIALLLLLIVLAAHTYAADPRPKFIIIKKGAFGTWKFIQVLTPPRKLHKWYYDEKTNTYYRLRSMIGIGLPMNRVYLLNN